MAIDVFNSGNIEAMQKSPALANILLEMHRAQGTPATTEGLMATMKENKPEAE